MPRMTTYTLNQDDPFEKVLIEMAKLRKTKSADYAGDDDPNQNFYDVAYQTNSTAGKAVEHMIATKQARLRVLSAPGRKPNHESVRDTRLDRAVYAVLAVVVDDEGGYNHGTLVCGPEAE